MTLYLMRHGECIPKEINAECPLSDHGLKEVMRMATLATKKEIEITKIFHSGKKRALQTAIIMKEQLKPLYGIAQTIGLNPNDDIFYTLKLIEKADNILIVSHLPHLERLIAYLITGNQEKTVVQFPTAGMVCLYKVDGKDKWKIKWKLTP
jgi:phosphohistidine phosphatase